MPDTASDELMTTRLMAFAVAPGMSSSALMTALRERVDATFLPRPLVLLDRLPRNSTGKLPRNVLEELAREHQRGAVHAKPHHTPD